MTDHNILLKACGKDGFALMRGSSIPKLLHVPCYLCG
jgi:hypothetical protein